VTLLSPLPDCGPSQMPPVTLRTFKCTISQFIFCNWLIFVSDLMLFLFLDYVYYLWNNLRYLHCCKFDCTNTLCFKKVYSFYFFYSSVKCWPIYIIFSIIAAEEICNEMIYTFLVISTSCMNRKTRKTVYAFNVKNQEQCNNKTWKESQVFIRPNTIKLICSILSKNVTAND